MMELLRGATASFIRNHFGEGTFSRYYLKTTRSSLKWGAESIRKTAEAFLISMNRFMDCQLIEGALMDPLLNDLSLGIQLNAEEIRSFMMMTQRRGEVFITKNVIPKMLKIVDEKVASKLRESTSDGVKGQNSMYLLFAILELLIYLLKPHRNRKFVFETGLRFTSNTAIFKCLRLPLSARYFELFEFKKLILLVIRIAQFFGAKSDITISLHQTLQPLMLALKDRVPLKDRAEFGPKPVLFSVYRADECRELLFMIYTSFQSIFSEKQMDAELDQKEPRASKEIKRIVLEYMEQRRSMNLMHHKKQTVSLKV